MGLVSVPNWDVIYTSIKLLICGNFCFTELTFCEFRSSVKPIYVGNIKMYVISGIMLMGDRNELYPNKFHENVQFQEFISHFELLQSN